MSSIENKEVMSKNLRYYLEKSGKTQKEIAEIVGVSTSTFNDWIKAKNYPRIDKIEILAKFFGILKSDLIERDWEEVQKNNDTLSDIVVRMRQDAEFLSIVKTLNSLDSAKLDGVKHLLTAFVE